MRHHTSNSFVWIPSLRALITGDIVFNRVHVWLADSTEESRANWLKSLASLSAMRPRIVVGGHKKNTDTPNSTAAITFAAKYIRDYEAARAAAGGAEDLIRIMKTKYPDAALADKILPVSAEAAFPRK